MKLPNGEDALINDDKLIEYVLNPEHPVGKHHAYLFDRLLGITQRIAAVLKEALVQAAQTVEIDQQIRTSFGTKFRL